MDQDENVVETKLYWGNMEKLTKGSTTYEVYYLAAGNGLNNIIVKQGSGISIYYTYTDQLGSIVAVTKKLGDIIAEQNFDAWGRKRNPANWTYTGVPATHAWLYRGFTGHEHVAAFNLINMNCRMYDPMTGLMMSPDDYVPLPFSPGGYNRYLYANGNPMKFVDPDGEFFIIDDWIIGFYRGLFSGGLRSAWQTANQQAGNAAKIWGGLFAFDQNKSFGGNILRIFSRFTWEGLQTLGGLGYSLLSNTLGQVESVGYYGGATTVTHTRNSFLMQTGMTLGSYINGNNTLRPDPNNSLFQHEYGHYIQSQDFGLAYIPRVAIPSLRSERGNFRRNYPSHDYHPVEQDANRRALKYFNKFIDGYSGWNFNPPVLGGNPILGYNPSQPFTNRENQVALKEGTLKNKWYDYVFYPSLTIPSVINTIIYNSTY